MHIDQQLNRLVNCRMARIALLAASLGAFFPAETQANPQMAASWHGTRVFGRATQLEGVRVQADTDSVRVTSDLQAAVQYNSGWLALGLLYLDLFDAEVSPRLLDREISVNQKYLKRILDCPGAPERDAGGV